MSLGKFKISLRNGENVSYDISAFVIFLTYSIIISSIDTPLNVLYARLISILIHAKFVGQYIIYNGVAFQITNLCLGLIEVGAILFLFFIDRKLSRSVIPVFFVLMFNFIRIIISILFGYEYLFRFFFELSVPFLWLIFRDDFSLKFVNFRIFPASRR